MATEHGGAGPEGAGPGSPGPGGPAGGPEAPGTDAPHDAPDPDAALDTAADAPEDSLHWRKSARSNPTGNCVELAALSDGGVAVRNSRDPAGPVLVYTRDEMVAFLLGAKDGDFDDLVGGDARR